MALIGKLSLSADQRELSGRFDCGGRLTATETADRVEVVYVASAVGRGQMACAAVPLQVSVAAPIGHRVIVDGVTGEPLALGR